MVMQLMTYDDRDKKGNKDIKEGREGGREGGSEFHDSFSGKNLCGLKFFIE